MKLLKRKCFKCGKRLNFEDFKRANLHHSETYLLKIWKSQYIQLYCCSCYPMEEEKTKLFLENVNSIVNKIWNHLEHEGDEHIKTHKYGPIPVPKEDEPLGAFTKSSDIAP